MPDILAAVDETAANALLHDAETAHGTLSESGHTSGSIFQLVWKASVSFSGGTVTLRPPDVIEIENCQVSYDLGLQLSIDLSSLDFCIPSVCATIPCVGEVCTPEICLDFPTIHVPVGFSSSSTFSAEFKLDARLEGGEWLIDVVVLGIPELDLGTDATLLAEAIIAAVSATLLAVPFIGPVLSAATALIGLAFGVSEVSGLLGDILTPFVSGLRFNIYKESQHFQVLPAEGAFDPAVFVTLTSLSAEVQDAGKPELVVSVDL